MAIYFSEYELRGEGGNERSDRLQRSPGDRHVDVPGAESVVRSHTRRHARQNGQARAETPGQVDGTDRREAARRQAAVPDAAEADRRTAEDELRGQGGAVHRRHDLLQRHRRIH